MRALLAALGLARRLLRGLSFGAEESRKHRRADGEDEQSPSPDHEAPAYVAT